MTIDVKGLAAGGVATAFSLLTQLKEEVVLEKVASCSYDASSGQTTKTEESQTLEGIFAEINMYDGRYPREEEQISADAVQIGDRNLLVEAAKVTSPIDTTFEVTRTKDGSKWGIITTKLDPTESLYELHIRRAT